MNTTENADRPNHHASHPGFAGVTGLLAGLTFAVGRSGDAELAARLTAVGACDTVVDIGCGPGVAARHAAGLGATVVGVDPAAVMLRLGRLLTRSPRVTYLTGAAERLPLDDGTASVVWSIATVHHWADIDAGLAETRRILRPGGRFLAIERRTRPGATGHASHGWTDEQAEAFAAMCADAGFDAVGVERQRAGRRSLIAVQAVSR